MDEAGCSFERYDDEFSSLLHQIQSSLNDPELGGAGGGGAGGVNNNNGNYTRNLLDQCDDLITQMSVEARGVSNAGLKRDLMDKVKMYKSKYKALKQQSERQGLLGSSADGGGGGDRDRLDQLQRNEDMLAGQNETLERARRSMMETEQVAMEITEELGNNREKLMSAHGRVREVSSLSGKAKRILSSMSTRATQQKMIVYAVAVGLVLAFFIMLWAMFR